MCGPSVFGGTDGALTPRRLRVLPQSDVALGLTEDANVYYATESATLTEFFPAYYNPVTGALVVADGDWTHALEVRLVHELTHALQDQHFDLSALRAASQDHGNDALLAYAALVEGDAMRVVWEYVERQGVGWHRHYDDSVPDAGFNQPGDPLAGFVNFMPYSRGRTAVPHLLAQGGNAGLDRVMRDLPGSTSQMFNPDRWLSHAYTGGTIQIVDVEAPDVPPGAEIVDGDTLGAAMLSVLPTDLDQQSHPKKGHPWMAGRSVRSLAGRRPDLHCRDGRVRQRRLSGEAKDILEPWATRIGAALEPVEVIAVWSGLSLTSYSNPGP